MECNFSYEHYMGILDKYLSEGYKFHKFDEYDKVGKKAIFLRHDVDVCIESAYTIGRLESCRKGLCSTFFMRTHATNYNPYGYNTIKIVKHLIKLGHEIGMHYEPTIRDYDNEEEFIKAFLIEKKMMELNYGIKIKSISTHEPRAEKFTITDKILPKLGLKCNTYSPKFTKDIKYISDSAIIPLHAGRWREGCMCKNINKYDKIQVLIHPVLWFGTTTLENY